MSPNLSINSKNLVSYIQRFLTLTTLLLLTCIVCFCIASSNSFAQEPAAAKVTYDDQVKQIFLQRCSSCHGGNKKEGDFDVTNYTNLMIGGGSGEVISAGSATDSYLYGLITHEDSPEMPPNGKIPDAEIKLIADWINLGALQNAGSKPQKAKPKMDLSLDADATKRPEFVAVPLRMSLQPVIETARPATTAIAASPWAPVVALATPKQILLHSTQTRELLGVLPMEEGNAHALRFSRNGSLLLAGGGKEGQSGKTILWDVKTGQRLATVGDELDTVLAADISASHELVAFGGPQKLVKVYRISDDAKLLELNKHTDWVTAIEFSPDGTMLASGDRNGGLHVWETSTGNELFALSGHSAAITAVSWRVDGKVLASSSEDGSIRVWETNKGSSLKNWPAHPGGTTSLQFLRDGKLASAGRDKTAKTWQQDGALVKQFAGLTDVAVAVAYCHETERVIAGDWAGEIRVWNSVDAVLIGDLDANPPKLEHRLETAAVAFETVKSKYESLAAQAAAATEKLTALQQSLDQATTKQTEIQTRIAQNQMLLTTLEQQTAALTSQLQHFTAGREQELAAQTAATEVSEKAVETAKLKPDDEAIKKMVVDAEAIKNSFTPKITALEDQLKKTDAELVAANSQLKSLREAMEADRPQLESMTAQVKQLTDQMPPTTKAVEESSAAAAAVQAEITQIETEITKWKTNLEFVGQLQALQQSLGKVETVAAEKQTLIEQQLQNLQAAQQGVETARQAKQLIETEADAIRQKMLELQTAQ